MSKSKWFGIAVAVILWSAILFGAGWLSRSLLARVEIARGAPVAGLTTPSSNPLLDEVWNHVRASFVGTVPSDTVRNYGEIRGALGTLNDRWTVFVEPQPRAIERDHMRGQFGGIGVNIMLDSLGRIVMDPQKGSPAAKAGIRKDDILIGIDGEKLPDKPDFNDAASKIRGDPGTPVRLTVQRGDKQLDFTVIRATIDVPSVDYQVISPTQPGGLTIGYIAIHQFTERTGGEVKQAILALRQAGSQAFLMDLRDNGGGLLSAAVDVASRFLSDGVVLYEERRDRPEASFPVTRDGDATAYTEPLAVLINNNTASASEIVAGAIQDRKRGELIGEQSYGKGSVQSIYDLSDGSSVHITSAKWLTPYRRAIDGVGLAPDIVQKRADGEGDQGKDSQLDRAVAELRKAVVAK
ncbi:MAG: S41 family peptidase [Chloroflexi bacterium]|nr:S41 family peptidase [Chloroflexota bacterium]MCL5274809.1 S41 family peptidase [Chloroflexota bacterium]